MTSWRPRTRSSFGSGPETKALGIYLLDYMQLEDLAAACDQASRWTFLAVIAPLRLPSATGSPVNPIAIL